MLNDIVKRAIENKIAKGFRMSISEDCRSMHKEVIELQCAISKEERASELADIIIFCAGVAGYLEIDLEQAVLDKMFKVERRIITIDDDGHYYKQEGPI